MLPGPRFIHAAKEIATSGSLTAFDGLVPYRELNNFFLEDPRLQSAAPRPGTANLLIEYKSTRLDLFGTAPESAAAIQIHVAEKH